MRQEPNAALPTPISPQPELRGTICQRSLHTRSTSNRASCPTAVHHCHFPPIAAPEPPPPHHYRHIPHRGTQNFACRPKTPWPDLARGSRAADHVRRVARARRARAAASGKRTQEPLRPQGGQSGARFSFRGRAEGGCVAVRCAAAAAVAAAAPRGERGLCAPACARR